MDDGDEGRKSADASRREYSSRRLSVVACFLKKERKNSMLALIIIMITAKRKQKK